MIIYYSTFNEGYANMSGRNCVAGKKNSLNALWLWNIDPQM